MARDELSRGEQFIVKSMRCNEEEVNTELNLAGGSLRDLPGRHVKTRSAL